MASTKSSARPSPAARAPQGTLANRIHALLHTVRLIGHAEDELCTLLHAAEQTGPTSAALVAELDELLGKLPAQTLLDDLAHLRYTIEAAQPAPAPSKVKAKPVRARKALPAKGQKKKATPRARTR